jgi:hypothetical protein
MLTEVGLPRNAIERYPHEFSGGHLIATIPVPEPDAERDQAGRRHQRRAAQPGEPALRVQVPD